MKIEFVLKCAVVLIAFGLLTNDRVSSEDGSNGSGMTWGKTIDPDGDCKFFFADGTLLITVPGAPRPHDLAADINVTNAPRVLQLANGDFTLQVQIDGRFTPGHESSQPGRTGYNGAGIIAMLDEKNVVTLARAVIQHHGREPSHYINFEIRVDGKLQRIGLTGDHAIPQSGPVFLRLEGRGQKLLGSVSTDGNNWTALASKEVPANWIQELQVGLVAISTSKEEFNPRFSRFQILK